MATDLIHSTNTGTPAPQGEIVLYQPDETVTLEVHLDEETVWLSQQQMAELFDKDRTVIGRHIRNIYKEGELEENITCAKFAHIGKEQAQHYEINTTHYEHKETSGYF
ncbi:MAG: cell filamentation protein Fic [Bacteroidales bacterium]|nr:cell filamentation protein Fic [Bacteroidales bacterium]